MPKKRLPELNKLIELFDTHSLAQLAEMFHVQENTIARKIAEARRQHLTSNPLQQQRLPPEGGRGGSHPLNPHA